MIQFTVQLFHPIFSDNAFSRVFQNLLNSQETEDQIFLPWSQKAMAAPAESHHLRSQLTFTKATLHAEHDAVNITSVSKTWSEFLAIGFCLPFPWKRGENHREFLEAGAATRTSYCNIPDQMMLDLQYGTTVTPLLSAGFDALPTCERGVFHLPERLKHE